MESRLPIFKKASSSTGTGTVPEQKPNCPIITATAAIRTKNVVSISSILASVTNSKQISGKRAASPEPVKRPLMEINRSKLRRSRSACDIRNINGVSNIVERMHLKRYAPTLAPIPPKTAKPNAIINKPLTSTRPKQPVINIATTTKSNCVTSSNNVPVAKKPVLNTKRIPAYDYKARYLDLLEKHKVLKDKYEITQNQLQHLDSLPEKYSTLQLEFENINELYNNGKIEIDKLTKEEKINNLKIHALTTSFSDALKELKSLKIMNEQISRENNFMNSELIKFKENNKLLTISNEYLNSEMDKYKNQLYRANIDRKELHNTIMDLKGNIRVFCRVRPTIQSEENRQLCGWNYLDEQSLEIYTNEIQNSTKPKLKNEFAFDHVFHPNCTQIEIFQSVSPLIQSAMDGYNVCIFAYGQTGSGKTFTMDGNNENIGIIPRTVELIYESIGNYERSGWQYELRVTCLEIYNEVLYDLLSDEIKDLEIRMLSAKSQTEIYVSNITEVTVSTADKLRELMEIAKLNRATAATISNERSSRSHAVTRIQLIGTHKERNETCIGTINLVDLAGSESPKTSIRMEETKKINKSLSELTNVILALLQKNDHIPYRNSKLTHLLMPSLGGNSKTLMFINVAPFQDCFTESVKSLRFAATVNACKLTKAKKNKFLNTSSSSTSSSINQSNY